MCAVLLGTTLRGLDLKVRTRFGRHESAGGTCFYGRGERSIQTHLAGRAAALLCGFSESESRAGCGSDFKRAHSRGSPAQVSLADAEVTELLRDHKHQVIIVAEALLRRGSLSGSEVRDLVVGTGGWQTREMVERAEAKS